MKKSKLWVVCLLVVVLGVTGFLYWPRPMEKLISWDKPVQVIPITMGTNEDMLPTTGTRSFVLEPGSDEHQALQALFATFRWHKGFDTLFQDGTRGFKGKTVIQFQEIGQEGALLEMAEGTSLISINGKAAKIGYFGAGDAQKLVSGVLDILTPLTPKE